MRLSDGRLSRDGTKQVQVAGVTHGTRLRLSRVTEEPCMVRRGAGGESHSGSKCSSVTARTEGDLGKGVRRVHGRWWDQTRHEHRTIWCWVYCVIIM